mgnify:CR=1 FL=1
MKDKTIPDSNDRKKIMFYDTPARHAQLKIRCQHDGINQSQFLRMVVTGYLEGNNNIVQFMHACKEKYNLQGKIKRNKARRLHQAGQELSKDLALKQDEIENIFDILESDT